jgi:fermentation-respiration switch protein FrsA (DUF1100 family)
MKIVFLVACLVLFAVFLRILESRMVFYPVRYPGGYWYPERYGLSLEDCWFLTSDGRRLHGWFMADDDAVATMLWCHGNAGNISDRLDNLARLSAVAINVFIFDYRGYGRSEGAPSEDGVYADAVAAYDYLLTREDVDAGALVLFGRSLGGAVAVDLATKRACAGLILESTFTHAHDMARTMFGPVPVQWLLRSNFDSLQKIAQVKVPLLMIHGTADTVVPYKLGKKLFSAANQPKAFYEIAGADHNDTYLVAGSAYFDTLAAFLQRFVVR